MPNLKALRSAVAIFGGTFDPLHYGHLRAAWETREALGVEDFRFLPAGQPPHRDQEVSPANHRLEMLKRGLPDGLGFRVDERELRRDGPSYMFDTLAELRGECGNAPLLLIIGQDSANSLDAWHRGMELFSLAHIVVMSRAGDIQRYSKNLVEEFRSRTVQSASDLARGSSGSVLNVQVTSLAISSSRIRELIGAGRSPQFLLPPSVLEYIEAQGLYSPGSD